MVEVDPEIFNEIKKIFLQKSKTISYLVKSFI